MLADEVRKHEDAIVQINCKYNKNTYGFPTAAVCRYVKKIKIKLYLTTFAVMGR